MYNIFNIYAIIRCEHSYDYDHSCLSDDYNYHSYIVVYSVVTSKYTVKSLI